MDTHTYIHKTVVSHHTHEHAYVIRHKTFHVNNIFFLLTFKQEGYVLRYILMLGSLDCREKNEYVYSVYTVEDVAKM